MIDIQTWADAASACPLLPPDIQGAVLAHLDRLSEFADSLLSELARFIVIEPGDVIPYSAPSGYDVLELDGGNRFVCAPEYAAQHGSWIEVVWIVSDDGCGIVLFVHAADDANPGLMFACQTALTQCASC